ncbi:hypothetical protein DM02DRAFT_655811 [Periconia macrospinosa]|uniref:Uncharacterized protein n=1 Tax=Periconia macrospinosa TaxID=97972 RepID=A0A2V1DP97_9PLEO|nr:hypothetical protein DM02DRAFT_655811 [Periconia macrospinosa]
MFRCRPSFLTTAASKRQDGTLLSSNRAWFMEAFVAWPWACLESTMRGTARLSLYSLQFDAKDPCDEVEDGVSPTDWSTESLPPRASVLEVLPTNSMTMDHQQIWKDRLAVQISTTARLIPVLQSHFEANDLFLQMPADMTLEPRIPYSNFQTHCCAEVDIASEL